MAHWKLTHPWHAKDHSTHLTQHVRESRLQNSQEKPEGPLILNLMILPRLFFFYFKSLATTGHHLLLGFNISSNLMKFHTTPLHSIVPSYDYTYIYACKKPKPQSCISNPLITAPPSILQPHNLPTSYIKMVTLLEVQTVHFIYGKRTLTHCRNTAHYTLFIYPSVHDCGSQLFLFPQTQKMTHKSTLV